DVLLPVFGAVFAHAAGNLVNTWVDHKSGLDTPSRADDRSLVDGIVSPNTVAGLAIACLTVAGAVCGYYVEVRGVATFLPVAAAGIAIGVFYTAKPISLKYNGLGDMAVFTAFGPLVMAGASLAMVGRVPASVLTLSLGVGLLTTGILHANNTRDIAVDAAAGATSCAVVLHRCTARSARTTGARGNLNAAYFTFLVLGGWAATLLAVLVQLVAGVLLPVPASVLNAAPPHIRAAAALALGTGALSPDAFEGWVAPHAPKEFFNIPHPYWVHTGVWGDVDVPQAVLWPAVTAVSIFACMLPWAFALIARFRRGGDDLATLPQQTAQFALSTGTAAFAALVPAAVLGRFTLAILFCLGGVNNIIMWHHASRLVQSKLSYFLASARGALCCVATSRNGHAEAALLPLPLASTALALAVAGQYLASLAFMFGVYPREAAMVLVAFLAPVTFLVHDFWNVGLRSNAWEPQ
ncbi:ubiad1, partial [Symbiodinium sp. KB8]